MKTITVSRWKLDELVNDPKEIDHILNVIEEKAKEIENSKHLLRSDIKLDEFKFLIKKIEDIYYDISKVESYVHLLHAADLRSKEVAALVNKVDRFVTNINNRLLFFDLWFKKDLDDVNANRLIDGIDEMYKDYLRHKRLIAKYTLSEKEEKIINILDVSGYTALIKLYDKITDSFEFVVKIDNKKRLIKNKEKLITLTRSSKAEEREGAYKALLNTYAKNSVILGEIYINLVNRWYDEFVRLRGYKSPISVRNVSNNIDDESVDTLLNVCKENVHIFQDYFKLKAKLLNMKRLRRYDIYAPLTSSQKRFSYEESIKIVLEAFEAFDVRFREYVEMLLDTHVDSELRKGKRSGAFCYSVNPKILPYILINFDGSSRNVYTLAHEFGHALHSILASNNSVLVYDAPLPLAETASVFAEMLVKDRLASLISKKEVLALLGEELDEMYATIIRQAYFTIFEITAHEKIINNSSIDDVSKLYLNNLKEQFGNSLILTKDFQYEWLYIPHFYHTPFYCYAYSFGNLLALSLYQEYKLNPKEFIDKYISILSAGGSKKPARLLEEHGFDINKKEFWQKGFELIKARVNELKNLS